MTSIEFTKSPPMPVHRLGPPLTKGALSVFPVFGPPALLEYVSLERGLEHGARIGELPAGPSVREVLISNPTGQNVLIYEGQQILGALQNRSVDHSILVPAYTDLRVPVSCIEQGRWHSENASEGFTVSPHAADPGLRATKRRDANRMRTGRPDQQRVWAAVGDRLARTGTRSDTASLEHAFVCGPQGGGISHVPGQVGALVAVSGRPVALDLVSREEVFASLLASLIAGYSMQAAWAAPAPADPRRAQAFLDRAMGARRVQAPASGLGRSFTLRGEEIAGAALTLNAELVALSAFPASD